MKTQGFWILICIHFTIFTSTLAAEPKIVCYYTNWSIYRPGTAKYSPQNINPYLCTHLIYAFGGFTKDNTLQPFDKYQDIEKGGYAKFTGLKTYNKNLKTLLAIGGWNEASSRFSPLVGSAERRRAFVKNAIKYLRQNHFDGLDLDWEYPTFRDGGKPKDRANYAQFVQELREEFDRESEKTGRPRLLLTLAIPAGVDKIDQGYDVPKLNQYLDWFNVLTYDYHDSFEPATNHHAPLYSLEEDDEYNYDSELNIDFSVKHLINAGADRQKLILGIPTYGRSYTLFNAEANEIGAPTDGPGEPGDATREKGFLAYYEICENIKSDEEWQVMHPNDKAMGPYCFKDDQWISYDDEEMARKKAVYVAQNNLGGIMFWSIDTDDFRGTCSGKPYPLIEAAKEGLLNSLGVKSSDSKGTAVVKTPTRTRQRPTTRPRISNDNSQKDQETTNVKDTFNRRRKPAAKTTAKPVTSAIVYNSRTTTPLPPTTPDPGTDFKCEEEGFFSHPRACNKYFWCLDSGPSQLGIVAHQFTCPSGLVFNQQADSCDYARNVVCAKTQPSTENPDPPSTTTRRPTTKLTTIRTTFRTTTTSIPRTTRTTTTTTTTPAYEEEEEYEYDNESVEPERDIEDPKVIKELIDLIKKAGGLEELEKHLKFSEGENTPVFVSTNSDKPATTQATFSKSLYDKVLKRKQLQNSFAKKENANKINTDNQSSNENVFVEKSTNKVNNTRYSSVIRNSRPNPQNAGLENVSDFDAFLKEKPQYVTIQRHRTTTSSNIEKPLNEETSEEENFSDEDTSDETTKSSYGFTAQPQYVNIQRTRGTTQSTSSVEEEEDVPEKVVQNTLSRRTQSNTPTSQYATINRRRPSVNRDTTEASAPLESKTETSDDSIEISTLTNSRTQSRYKSINRGTPAAPPQDVTEDPEKLDSEPDSTKKFYDSREEKNDISSKNGVFPSLLTFTKYQNITRTFQTTLDTTKTIADDINISQHTDQIADTYISTQKETSPAPTATDQNHNLIGFSLNDTNEPTTTIPILNKFDYNITTLPNTNISATKIKTDIQFTLKPHLNDTLFDLNDNDTNQTDKTTESPSDVSAVENVTEFLPTILSSPSPFGIQKPNNALLNQTVKVSQLENLNARKTLVEPNKPNSFPINNEHNQQVKISLENENNKNNFVTPTEQYDSVSIVNGYKFSFSSLTSPKSINDFEQTTTSSQISQARNSPGEQYDTVSSRDSNQFRISSSSLRSDQDFEQTTISSQILLSRPSTIIKEEGVRREQYDSVPLVDRTKFRISSYSSPKSNNEFDQTTIYNQILSSSPKSVSKFETTSNQIFKSRNSPGEQYGSVSLADRTKLRIPSSSSISDNDFEQTTIVNQILSSRPSTIIKEESVGQYDTGNFVDRTKFRSSSYSSPKSNNQFEQTTISNQIPSSTSKSNSELEQTTSNQIFNSRNSPREQYDTVTFADRTKLRKPSPSSKSDSNLEPTIISSQTLSSRPSTVLKEESASKEQHDAGNFVDRTKFRISSYSTSKSNNESEQTTISNQIPSSSSKSNSELEQTTSKQIFQSRYSSGEQYESVTFADRTKLRTPSSTAKSNFNQTSFSNQILPSSPSLKEEGASKEQYDAVNVVNRTKFRSSTSSSPNSLNDFEQTTPIPSSSLKSNNDFEPTTTSNQIVQTINSTEQHNPTPLVSIGSTKFAFSSLSSPKPNNEFEQTTISSQILQSTIKENGVPREQNRINRTKLRISSSSSPESIINFEQTTTSNQIFESKNSSTERYDSVSSVGRNKFRIASSISPQSVKNLEQTTISLSDQFDSLPYVGRPKLQISSTASPKSANDLEQTTISSRIFQSRNSSREKSSTASSVGRSRFRITSSTTAKSVIDTTLEQTTISSQITQSRNATVIKTRGRGQSRFRNQTPTELVVENFTSSIRPRNSTRRLRPFVHPEEDAVDQNSLISRTLRPSSLGDDLSSLTAFDFSRKNYDNTNTGGARRRTRPTLVSNKNINNINSTGEVTNSNLSLQSSTASTYSTVTENSTTNKIPRRRITTNNTSKNFQRRIVERRQQIENSSIQASNINRSQPLNLTNPLETVNTNTQSLSSQIETPSEKFKTSTPPPVILSLGTSIDFGFASRSPNQIHKNRTVLTDRVKSFIDVYTNNTGPLNISQSAEIDQSINNATKYKINRRVNYSSLNTRTTTTQPSVLEYGFQIIAEGETLNSNDNDSLIALDQKNSSVTTDNALNASFLTHNRLDKSLDINQTAPPTLDSLHSQVRPLLGDNDNQFKVNLSVNSDNQAKTRSRVRTVKRLRDPSKFNSNIENVIDTTTGVVTNTPSTAPVEENTKTVHRMKKIIKHVRLNNNEKVSEEGKDSSGSDIELKTNVNSIQDDSLGNVAIETDSATNNENKTNSVELDSQGVSSITSRRAFIQRTSLNRESSSNENLPLGVEDTTTKNTVRNFRLRNSTKTSKFNINANSEHDVTYSEKTDSPLEVDYNLTDQTRSRKPFRRITINETRTIGNEENSRYNSTDEQSNTKDLPRRRFNYKTGSNKGTVKDSDNEELENKDNVGSAIKTIRKFKQRIPVNSNVGRDPSEDELDDAQEDGSKTQVISSVESRRKFRPRIITNSESLGTRDSESQIGISESTKSSSDVDVNRFGTRKPFKELESTSTSDLNIQEEIVAEDDSEHSLENITFENKELDNNEKIDSSISTIQKFKPRIRINSNTASNDSGDDLPSIDSSSDVRYKSNNRFGTRKPFKTLESTSIEHQDLSTDNEELENKDNVGSSIKTIRKFKQRIPINANVEKDPSEDDLHLDDAQKDGSKTQVISTVESKRKFRPRIITNSETSGTRDSESDTQYTTVNRFGTRKPFKPLESTSTNEPNKQEEKVEDDDIDSTTQLVQENITFENKELDKSEKIDSSISTIRKFKPRVRINSNTASIDSEDDLPSNISPIGVSGSIDSSSESRFKSNNRFGTRKPFKTLESTSTNEPNKLEENEDEDDIGSTSKYLTDNISTENEELENNAKFDTSVPTVRKFKQRIRINSNTGDGAKNILSSNDEDVDSKTQINPSVETNRKFRPRIIENTETLDTQNLNSESQIGISGRIESSSDSRYNSITRFGTRKPFKTLEATSTIETDKYEETEDEDDIDSTTPHLNENISFDNEQLENVDKFGSSIPTIRKFKQRVRINSNAGNTDSEGDLLLNDKDGDSNTQINSSVDTQRKFRPRIVVNSETLLTRDSVSQDSSSDSRYKTINRFGTRKPFKTLESTSTIETNKYEETENGDDEESKTQHLEENISSDNEELDNNDKIDSSVSTVRRFKPRNRINSNAGSNDSGDDLTVNNKEVDSKVQSSIQTKRKFRPRIVANSETLNTATFSESEVGISRSTESSSDAPSRPINRFRKPFKTLKSTSTGETVDEDNPESEVENNDQISSASPTIRKFKKRVRINANADSDTSDEIAPLSDTEVNSKTQTVTSSGTKRKFRPRIVANSENSDSESNAEREIRISGATELSSDARYKQSNRFGTRKPFQIRKPTSTIEPNKSEENIDEDDIDSTTSFAESETEPSTDEDSSIEGTDEVHNETNINQYSTQHPSSNVQDNDDLNEISTQKLNSTTPFASIGTRYKNIRLSTSTDSTTLDSLSYTESDIEGSVTENPLTDSTENSDEFNEGTTFEDISLNDNEEIDSTTQFDESSNQSIESEMSTTNSPQLSTFLRSESQIGNVDSNDLLSAGGVNDGVASEDQLSKSEYNITSSDALLSTTEQVNDVSTKENQLKIDNVEVEKSLNNENVSTRLVDTPTTKRTRTFRPRTNTNTGSELTVNKNINSSIGSRYKGLNRTALKNRFINAELNTTPPTNTFNPNRKKFVPNKPQNFANSLKSITKIDAEIEIDHNKTDSDETVDGKEPDTLNDNDQFDGNVSTNDKEINLNESVKNDEIKEVRKFRPRISLSSDSTKNSFGKNSQTDDDESNSKTNLYGSLQVDGQKEITQLHVGDVEPTTKSSLFKQERKNLFSQRNRPQILLNPTNSEASFNNETDLTEINEESSKHTDSHNESFIQNLVDDDIEENSTQSEHGYEESDESTESIGYNSGDNSTSEFNEILQNSHNIQHNYNNSFNLSNAEESNNLLIQNHNNNDVNVDINRQTNSGFTSYKNTSRKTYTSINSPINTTLSTTQKLLSNNKPFLRNSYNGSRQQNTPYAGGLDQIQLQNRTFINKSAQNPSTIQSNKFIPFYLRQKNSSKNSEANVKFSTEEINTPSEPNTLSDLSYENEKNSITENYIAHTADSDNSINIPPPHLTTLLPETTTSPSSTSITSTTIADVNLYSTIISQEPTTFVVEDIDKVTEISTTSIPDTTNRNVETQNSYFANRKMKTTTTTTTSKPTTLHHIFAIDYDSAEEDRDTNNTNIGSSTISTDDTSTDKMVSAEEISKRFQKLVEVNRIVEIYSKQEKHTIKTDKLTNINSTVVEENLSHPNDLMVEKVPTLDKIGEISRLISVKLQNNNDSSSSSNLHEILQTITLTKPNELHTPRQQTFEDDVQLRQVNLVASPATYEETKIDVKPLINRVDSKIIFDVETSTIALEGLFDNTKMLKENHNHLNDNEVINYQIDKPPSVNIPINDHPDSVTVVTESTIPSHNYVQSLRPESNEANPLVISIANLDQVVLSKISKTQTENNNLASVNTPSTSSPLLTLNSNLDLANRGNVVLPSLIKDTSSNNFVVNSNSETDNAKFQFNSEKQNNLKTDTTPLIAKVSPTQTTSLNSTRRPVPARFASSILRKKTFATTTIQPSVNLTKTVVSTKPPPPKVIIRRKLYSRPPSSFKTTTTNALPTSTDKVTTPAPKRARPSLTSYKFSRPSRPTKKTEAIIIDQEVLTSNDQFLSQTTTNSNKQLIELDNLQNSELVNEEIRDILEAMSKTPLPVLPTVATTTNRHSDAIGNTINRHRSRPIKPEPNIKEISIKSSIEGGNRRKLFQKIPKTKDEKQPKSENILPKIQKLSNDYDYYDDSDSQIVHNSQVKVILHGSGTIECLDQGNFPHPVSCKKFISCAIIETGGVAGWEYTCPKGLNYDPVGGICNWATGLGCKE